MQYLLSEEEYRTLRLAFTPSGEIAHDASDARLGALVRRMRTGTALFLDDYGEWKLVAPKCQSTCCLETVQLGASPEAILHAALGSGDFVTVKREGCANG